MYLWPIINSLGSFRIDCLAVRNARLIGIQKPGFPAKFSLWPMQMDMFVFLKNCCFSCYTMHIFFPVTPVCYSLKITLALSWRENKKSLSVGNQATREWENQSPKLGRQVSLIPDLTCVHSSLFTCKSVSSRGGF